MDANTNTAVDEFDDAELASLGEDGQPAEDEFSGYEAAGKLGDIDDVPVHTIIARATKVTLGVAGFQLFDRKKGSECISVSLEVVAPAEFIGDETNFKSSFWLKTAVKEGSNTSAWKVTKGQIGRMLCGVYQCTAKDPRVDNFLDPIFTEVGVIEDRAERRRAFYKALVEALNSELQGKTFETKIGVDDAKPAPNGKMYRRRQTIGYVQYPGCREKDAE